MNQFVKYSLFAPTLFFVCCKQRYDPVVQANTGYLVVDGFLNNSNDSTIIRLSRTTPLKGDYYVDRVGELNAKMTVEDESGALAYMLLPSDNNGTYAVPMMSLDVNKKYHLRINTADGNQYLSEDIPVKPNPAIDSINWVRSNEGVTIYVNTHDPLNSTHYYRWDYSETWEYYTKYYSGVKYIDTPYYIKTRNPDELVNHCWKTVNSKELLPGSTIQLSQDIVNERAIRFIPLNSFELVYKYSISVDQYAVTQQAFDYYQALKKNTEQTGTIFDAQPFTLAGNIHCITNPAVPVLGFLTATTLQTKRIYINNAEVAPWDEDILCPDPRVVPKDSFDFFFSEKLYPGFLKMTPIDGVYDAYGELTGIKAGLKKCTDCISRGGTNQKPGFWP